MTNIKKHHGLWHISYKNRLGEYALLVNSSLEDALNVLSFVQSGLNSDEIKAGQRVTTEEFNETYRVNKTYRGW